MISLSEIAAWVSSQFFRRNEHLRSPTARSDAGRPIVLDLDGYINDGFIDATYIAAVVGAMVTGNTELGITVTYQSVDHTLDFTLNDHTHQSSGSGVGGQLDHGLALTGLTDDDHSQYMLLNGRSGGQTLYGDTAANGDITLYGTLSATKTSSYVILQPTGGNVVVGSSVAETTFTVHGNSLWVEGTPSGGLAATAGTGIRISTGNIYAYNYAAGAATTLTLQSPGGATVIVGTLNVQAAVDLDTTLNVDGATVLQTTLNAKGAVDFDSTLNVDGVATFQAIVNLSMGTQDYNITNSTTAAILQGKTSNTAANFWIMSNDGDGTDSNSIEVWGKGTPAAITNRERVILLWNTSTSAYEILSEADGTGTLRPLILYTEGNTNQIYLGTNGRVGILNASPATAFDVTGTITADGLNVQGATDLDSTLNVDGISSLADAIRFYNASIAHGMTTLVPTDVGGQVVLNNTTEGGLTIQGFTDVGTRTPLTLMGVHGSTTPTVTIPGVRIRADKKSGTTSGAIASTELAFEIVTSATSLFTVMGNGDTNIKGALDVDSTLNVDGVATFQAIVNLSMGTQDYYITNSTTAAILQGKTSNTAANFWLMSNDGDGTDSNSIEVWGKGTPGAITNRERIIFLWNTSTSAYEILSEADGTGTLRPIILYTEGNSNQVYLGTNGRTGFGTASPATTVEVNGTLTATGVNVGEDTMTIFDDGTWTVLLTDSGDTPTYTASVQAGTYQKTNTKVDFQFRFTVSTISGGDTDTARFSLPFTSIARAQVVSVYTNGGAGSYDVIGVIPASTNYVEIYGSIYGSGTLLSQDLGVGEDFIIGGTYFST